MKNPVVELMLFNGPIFTFPSKQMIEQRDLKRLAGAISTGVEVPTE